MEGAVCVQDKDACEGSRTQQSGWTDETANITAQERERYCRSESRRIRETDCRRHDQDSGLNSINLVGLQTALHAVMLTV